MTHRLALRPPVTCRSILEELTLQNVSMLARQMATDIFFFFRVGTRRRSLAVHNSRINSVSITAGRGVLSKSLGGGVRLGHWNPYAILDHDQLDFAILFQTSQPPKTPILSETNHFP